MHWKPVGRDAVIVYFAGEIGDESLRRSLAITSELETNPTAGLLDFVPGFTSVLLQFQPGIEIAPDPLLAHFRQLSLPALPEWPVHEIPVTYDGEYLERVATSANLTVPEVIALHSARTY